MMGALHVTIAHRHLGR